MTPTDSRTADQLDALTRTQRDAHEATADARQELTAAGAALGDELAAAMLNGTDANVDELADRHTFARQRLELAELAEQGLARTRRRITPADRPAPPAVGDPRGIVTVRAVGRPGLHACNVPSTARRLEGGQVVDVTFDDAVALASAGHVEVVGTPPDGWPREVPASGQLAASLA